MNKDKLLKSFKSKLIELRKIHDENPKVQEFTHKLNNFLSGRKNKNDK